MAICRFYQQGGCRFGNRCYNEHVDPQRSNYAQPQRNNNQRQSQGPSPGFSFSKALEQVARVEPGVRRTVHFDDSQSRYHSNTNSSNSSYSSRTSSQQQPASSGFSFSRTFNQIQQQPVNSSFVTVSQHDIDMSAQISQPLTGSFHSPHHIQSPFGYSAPPQQFIQQRPSPWQSSGLNVSVADQSMESPRQSATQPVTCNFNTATGKEYSLITDLTPEEFNAFKAESFTFGKIPLKPPPLELCK